MGKKLSTQRSPLDDVQRLFSKEEAPLHRYSALGDETALQVACWESLVPRLLTVDLIR